MASNYAAFDCLIDNGDGTTTPLAGVTVHIWNIDGAASLGTVVADGSGHVVAASVSPAAGTHLRFGFLTTDAIAGYKEDITA